MQNTTSKNLLTFIKNSPSAFHSIASIKKILIREGFNQIEENEVFNITKGGKYFVTRNDSSIIAFKVGTTLDNFSFNMVASHSDSPSFKVKPNSINDTGKFLNVAVEGYGGMLCSTWFDRPLSIAGRVLIKNDDVIESKLINIDKNLLSIPSIPIHFNREANSGYNYNIAKDMQPTLALSIKDYSLKDLIATTLNENKENILSYDLYLYNRQEGYFWGLDDEFISSCKLDDLQCAYTTLLGFVKATNPHNISIYCCFDNEEIGSSTMQGANSNFLESTLKRISNSLGKNEEEFTVALANSFMVSADNAHSVHPTHSDLTDSLNYVLPNKGIVIKSNASQSYCSDALSIAIFKEICKNADVPTQDFTNRSDIRGGSTLGNISIRHVSIKSIDIGLAQFAMHSCNETSGAKDSDYMIKAIKEYYESNIKFLNSKIIIKK